MKTLKDLTKTIQLTDKGERIVGNSEGNVVFAIELRQEAIKWIRELIATKKDYPIANVATINWIKYFFNIRGDDL